MAEKHSTIPGCVYQARNKLNGKCYIGKTVQRLSRRRWAHERNADRKNTSCLLHKAIAKYGKDSFEWSILFQSKDNDILLQMEVVFIRDRNTKVPQGYNLTEGGEGVIGRAVSERHKEKLRELFTGKPCSEEKKAKISAALTGRKLGPEFSAACSRAQRGRRHSAATRAKMSQYHKNHPQSEEARRESRRRLLGNKFGCFPKSREHARKIADGLKKYYQTHTISDATRKKMSESAKHRQR